MWLYHKVMSPNDADGMANSVDPDQTAPRSESALFAQTCLSENLGKLRYVKQKSQSLWNSMKYIYKDIEKQGRISNISIFTLSVKSILMLTAK